MATRSEARNTNYVREAELAAAAIWLKQPGVTPSSPRHPEFARHFLDECTRHLSSTSALIQDALDGAARSAEGVNVEPFQGLIEVIQNADDQRASSVRFRLRGGPTGQQMLVVHDGMHVEHHQVSAMMLPYISTKHDDPTQKGRFGIGLKTLRRISTALSVHSAPFHFSSGADGAVSILRVEAEPAIEGFYDPSRDTLIVLELNSEFREEDLAEWFEAWTDDGLLFLDHVRRFSWEPADGDRIQRSTTASEWLPVAGGEVSLERRTVVAGDQQWSIYRAEVPTDGPNRAHKTTGETTAISVATCGRLVRSGIFVGLRTRIATSLTFALDAQFDPSHSRETILDNAWNRWLVDRCGDILAAVTRACLLVDPPLAWSFAALPGDAVGDDTASWPRDYFDAAFSSARTLVAAEARVAIDGTEFDLSELAHEAAGLEHLLTPLDVESLAAGKRALPLAHRDKDGRWRSVLSTLGVAREVGHGDLLAAITSPAFASKCPDWWVEAAASLVIGCPMEGVIGARLWLREDGERVPCRAKNTSAIKLVYHCDLPPLSRRHGLFDKLHPAFGSAAGETARNWLVANAAYTTVIEARDELLAYAEVFSEDPQRLDGDALREIRDMLHQYPDRSAAPIGRLLARAILIEVTAGEKDRTKAWEHPDRIYIPKSIDKDNPNWPKAAAGLPGMLWASPSLEDKLKTGLGRFRKAADGLQVRGARRFLSLIGAAAAPRLETGASPAADNGARWVEMRALGATHLEEDVRSPDLERALAAICDSKRPKKERRERAISLMRALSREWTSRYLPHSSVTALERKRKHVYSKGQVAAHWLFLLKNSAWIPVGRDRFARPGDAALRNNETAAVLRSPERFVQGIGPGDISEDFAEAIGLTIKIRASDLVESIREMRDRPETFDLSRLRLAYQQLSRLCSKAGWGKIDDLTVGELRKSFDERNGLVLILQRDGQFGWRRINQVMRGRRVLPDVERFTIDPELNSALWSTIGVRAPTLQDCCIYLKEHATKAPNEAQDGVLVQIYTYMTSLLGKTGVAGAEAIRFAPLACGSIWWAKRPIMLVDSPELRTRLAEARPELRFWRPPCDLRAIEPLVAALAVTRMEPAVRALAHESASDRGEELSARFAAAVDHLSDSLIRSRPSLRKALTISWEALRSIPLHVHEELVPVHISHELLGQPIFSHLSVHLTLSPLALHVTEGSIGTRDGAGAAIASLFPPSADWPIYLEWESAWNAAKDKVAAALRMDADDEEHARRMREAAQRIAEKKGAEVKLNPRRKETKKSEAGQRQQPPRELKEFQPAISAVDVVNGSGPTRTKAPKRTPLSRRRKPPGSPLEPPLPGTSYSNQDLEQYGWDIITHVLTHGEGKQLEDFRRAHNIGADGVVNWKEFVELKASGRSMSTSVDFPPSEFRRAVERRNDYVLALVHGAEKGQTTKVKLIFDPVARASIRETEGVRLTGLQNAAGIEVELGDDGAVKSSAADGSAPPSSKD